MATDPEDAPFPLPQDYSQADPTLSPEEQELLEKQDSRLVTTFRADKFQRETRKHWDIFYKRNTDKFFKDRHWTLREFADLADWTEGGGGGRVLLEVGCGVGNFVFPLLEHVRQNDANTFIYACDFSPRAVQLVRDNSLYDPALMYAFECDVTAGDGPVLPTEAKHDQVDLVSLVFVLSAIKPEAFPTVFARLFGVLRPGGRLLFRDYAVNDLAMVRFAPGTKIGDRHYLRQDGTTSYFFSRQQLRELAEAAGFEVTQLNYVHRQTVNVKENVKAERRFVQCVLIKK